MTMQPPTIEDIRAAARRIDGAVVRTPMLKSRYLSDLIGAEIWLKFENLQLTGAYKERGALNKLLQLSVEEKARGVITASAGNHAQAVACHARRLGIPATIVMPSPTPTVKVSETERYGAKVLLFGNMFDDAYAKAREMEREQGLTFVHPFDDPQIIAGQGTIALEMLEDAPDLDMLCVPIGGGGLLSGIAIAARAEKPDIALVGVEAELYPAMKCAIEGCNLPVGGDTLAEGIAVKNPGKLTERILADLVDDILLAPELQLERSVALLVRAEKSVVEGAGAAGLAAMLANPEKFAGRKVGTVLCGGNIDTHLLAYVLVRDLARQGRMARLHIAAQDRPGALAAIAACCEKASVNIIEIYHSRIFTRLPAKDTMIEVECEARDPEAIDSLIAMLEERGFQVERAPVD